MSSTESSRTDAPMRDDESDGGEWADLLELLPEWSDGVDDDALWVDDLVTDELVEDSIVATSLDNASLSGSGPNGESRQGQRRRSTVSTRAQRAMEIRRLQRECKDLYEMLLALREEVKAAGSPRHHASLSLPRLVGAGRRNQLTSSTWVTEAGKQRELLVLAERANRELKRNMRLQKREARSLHRILTKRIADAQFLWNQLYSSVDAMPTPSRVSSPIFSDTCMVFASLLQETEAMRPKVDIMLQYLRSKVALPVATGSFQEWKMTRCSDAEDTVLVEMIDVEELPFPIPNVCNAVENMYRTYEMDNFAKQVLRTLDSVEVCIYRSILTIRSVASLFSSTLVNMNQNFNTSDDTIMATSFFTYDHDEGTMHARLRQVAQRFATDTHAAFVSTFIVELLAQTPAEEVPVDKVQEWRIVSTTEDGTTLHQTFAVLLPKVAQSISSLSGSKQLFSQLIGHWLASFTCTNQQIENLLLNPPSSAHMLRRKRPKLHENWTRLDGEQPQNASSYDLES
ncbi:hypothetical protein FI667_g3014, partial [Globisporangium splendens]